MGAEVLSSRSNLKTCKITKPVKASPPQALPDEPQGEAKNETVNPNSLESRKDMEVDGGDNSHELSIKINEPKAGNDQELAPPNVISKTIMEAPDPAATTTATIADTDKDDADYVFKVSASLLAVSWALIISNMKHPPSEYVIFMFALVALLSVFTLGCQVGRDNRVSFMMSKILCSFNAVLTFFAIGTMVVQKLPKHMVIWLGIVKIVVIVSAAVAAWIFSGKRKED